MGRRALDSLFVVVGMSIAGCGYLSTDAYIADRGTEVYGGEAASEYRTLLGLSDDKQTNPDKTSNQAALVVLDEVDAPLDGRNVEQGIARPDVAKDER